MRIDFTPDQWEQFDNPFFDITYTVTIDGVDVDGNINDDDYREIPDVARIVQPGITRVDPDDETSAITMYSIAHPTFTWEDEVILKFVLDERAAVMQGFADLPQADRAEARQTYRQDARTAARQDARREARRLARIADRREARRMFRQDLRQDARIAQRLADRQAELDAESIT